MLFVKKLFKITDLIKIVIIFIFFSTFKAESFEKYNSADNISDYITGILLFNQSKYEDSYKYLKKLNGLEKSHLTFPSKYLYTLVNSGNFIQAFNYSKKIEREKKNSFESDLIIGIYYLKNSKYDLSNQYFLKAKQKSSKTLLDSYIVNTLLLWSDLRNNQFDKARIKLNQLDNRFENIKKIQSAFLNCFFDRNNTEKLFNELISNNETDFSRYNYFYANYLKSIGKDEKAKKVIESSLKKYPRNLLLNQYILDLNNAEKNFDFNCKKEKDVAAEIIYIAANAMSSQSMYSLSNFYLNLSKFLNKEFHAFDTLLAENFYKISDFSSSKKIYEKLINHGAAFKWFSYKQISRI